MFSVLEEGMRARFACFCEISFAKEKALNLLSALCSLLSAVCSRFSFGFLEISAVEQQIWGKKWLNLHHSSQSETSGSAFGKLVGKSFRTFHAFKSLSRCVMQLIYSTSWSPRQAFSMIPFQLDRVAYSIPWYCGFPCLTQSTNLSLSTVQSQEPYLDFSLEFGTWG